MMPGLEQPQEQYLDTTCTAIREECYDRDLFPVLVLTRHAVTGQIIILQPEVLPPTQVLSWLEQAAIAYTKELP